MMIFNMIYHFFVMLFNTIFNNINVYSYSEIPFEPESKYYQFLK